VGRIGRVVVAPIAGAAVDASFTVGAAVDAGFTAGAAVDATPTADATPITVRHGVVARHYH
jgi:hypothetical protein